MPNTTTATIGTARLVAQTTETRGGLTYAVGVFYDGLYWWTGSDITGNKPWAHHTHEYLSQHENWLVALNKVYVRAQEHIPNNKQAAKVSLNEQVTAYVDKHNLYDAGL